MTDRGRSEVTQLLRDWRAGNEGALDALLPAIHHELQRLARGHLRRDRPDHTLQTNDLLHEAFVRLVAADVSWRDRVHFFAVAATTMRRVLVDHARARNREKRGGGAPKLAFDENLAVSPERLTDLLEVDEALSQLAERDTRKARVVELHFFGGMSYEEIAEVLDVSLGTVRRDMRLSKAWLRRAMG